MKTLKPILFLLALALGHTSWAQVVSVSNTQPLRGEKVQITYDPVPEAAFSLTDPVFVYYRVMEESGQDYKDVLRLQRAEGKLVGELTMPDQASVIRLSFVSNGDWDREQSQLLQIVDADGNFYRNGYGESVYSDNEAYQKELDAYPDNYAIYRARWQILAASQPEEGPETIRKEWRKIERKGTRNAEYYHAKVSAHASLGEFETAIEGLGEMMDQFPASPWIGDAFSFLRYQLFSKQAGPQPELDERVKEFTRMHPGSEMAKDQIGSFVLGAEIEDTELVASIAQAWIEKDPTLPMMHLAAARVAESREEKLAHLNQASNLFLNREIAMREGLTWNYLVYYMLPVVRTYLEADAPAEAMGVLTILEQNTDRLEGDFYEMVGASWKAMGQYQKAIEAYLQAADLGSEDGSTQAKELFMEYFDPSGDSFDSYKEETLAALTAAEEVPMAADFSVTDMDGNAVALSALRGRVVVLNFWFIGCAPCRIEMPGLNELVADYADEEVAFVAFALDSQSSLEKFLTQKEFDYTIIPDADDVSEAYGVQAFPTHVIIDKEGRVRSTLTGGSETRHEDLKPLIDRLLR